MGGAVLLKMQVLAQPVWWGRWPQAWDAKDVERLKAVLLWLDKRLADQPSVDAGVDAQQALAVGEALLGLGMDAQSVAVGVLVASAGDDGDDLGLGLSVDELTRVFGAAMARLFAQAVRLDAVDAVHAQLEGDLSQQTERLRRMLLAMVDDVRVVIIKLAQRLVLLRSLKSADEARRQRVARETLDVYAPLAARLGIAQVKWELEDLSLRFSQQSAYFEIASALNERREDREAFIESVKAEIAQTLEKAGLKAEVSGRPKHIFSIWKKMQRKHLSFEQLFDVRAVRVMVAEESACYTAQGLVHGLWQPIPKEFDDYIANPKPNGYQSLHTAVIGPEGKTVEIQIRSQAMHEHAELGVAAHWRYKDGSGSDAALDAKLSWLRGLLDPSSASDGNDDLLERLRLEALEERVYVLTPQGRVLDLPPGATAVDFAYAVHTEVGHRCRGAKVNGRIVPLNRRLVTGEQVEVLTAKEGGPSRDWLSASAGYTASATTRNKIRAWFNAQDFEQNVAQGRSLLDRECKRLNVLAPDLAVLARRFKQDRVETMLAEIGRGLISAGQIAAALQDQVLAQSPAPADEAEDDAFLPRKRRPSRPSEGAVSVRGVGDLMTSFASCCHPVPSDQIVGFITRGRGVSVHRQDCPNVLNLSEAERARLVEVDWGGQAEEADYSVDLSLIAIDRQGLLRDVTTAVAANDVNVLAVRSNTDKKRHEAKLQLTVEVRDAAQLSGLMTKLSLLPNVLEVQRAH